MTSRSARNQQDPFSGAFNSDGDGSDSSNFPAGGNGGSSSPPPTPALSGEAIQAEAAFTGATTTVVVTSGGITFDLIFDAAASAAPASFRAGIEQAATILAATITNKITVNLEIDYSGTGGGAAAGPDSGQFVNYSTVRADLIADAKPGDTTFNALPTGSTIQGQSQVAVWNTQLKVFGLLSPNDTTTDDGSATFATDINPNLLVGVALHELTHAMGRVPYGPQPDIFEFYRYTSPGTLLFTDAIPAPASYFSLDGGNTKIADYGQTSDPSDFLNSPGSNLTPTDAFDEFYNNNTNQTLTAIDKEELDALGFTLASPQNIVVAGTASEAVQGGAAVTLLSGQPTITDTASTTLSSATIKIANAGGSAVAGDELYVNGIQNGPLGSGVTASWNATTDTLTLTGTASLAVYDTLLSEVTYKDTGTDSSTGSHPVRTVTWSVNDGTTNFNTTSLVDIDRAPVVTVANVVLGANSPAVAASSLFTASDADGDAIATYAFEDTGNGHFVLNGVAQANNQEIDVTAAQLALLTYQGTGGVDSLEVRVNDGTAWSAWQSFTVTAPVGTVIESFGSTSLVEVGNNYYLENTTTGTGPELKLGGVPVVAGQFGAEVPIGVEATASGYEVAWELPGATNQYTVWNTDTNGNAVSNATGGPVSGTSPLLESLETSFHQDLNGDGIIGPPANTKVIESFGATSLVEVGNNYYLESNTTGAGPELKLGGVPVVAGQFGTEVPIGAEATASGYEVAWELPGATNVYTVWNTDTSGNAVSNATGGPVSGTSPVLESLETSFHQDLNGDGVIGIPTGPTGPTAPTAATSAVAEANLSSIEADGSSGAPPQNGGQTSISGIWSAPSGQDSNGWHFDFAAHSGGSSTVEPELSAPWHDAQAGQQQPAFPSASDGQETLLHPDGTASSTVLFADLHAGHFFFH